MFTGAIPIKKVWTMKQAKIVKHKPYQLVWIQTRGRPELNGAFAEVVRKQGGGKRPAHIDCNGTIQGEGRRPARYYLNIGIKVGAENLKEIENAVETQGALI
jgi:hypothetical protein